MGVKFRGRGKTLPLSLAYIWIIAVVVVFLGYLYYLDPVIFSVVLLALFVLASIVYAMIVIASHWD